jgi:hypothetical protein
MTNNEIERAIETLNGADTWKLIVWGTPSFPAMLNRLTSACLLARDVLTAELSRQENAPLTCDGCRREDFQWVDECIGCVRQSHHEDRYEPKGEKA